MNTEKQTDDPQISAVALQYTLQDFKISLVIVSALANMGIFVTWLALNLAA